MLDKRQHRALIRERREIHEESPSIVPVLPGASLGVSVN